MKNYSKINKRVNDSMANCRKVLTESTIELLKMLGTESEQDVDFGHILFMHSSKGNVNETTLVDRIAYCDEGREDNPFYLVYFGDRCCQSSFFLSIDKMFAIFEEVKRLVRHNED